MGAGVSTRSIDCVLPEVLEDTDEDVSSCSSSPSTPHRGATGNTVIIWDWDDTLLASTAVRGHQWTVEQMWELEAAIESVLRTSMELGETLIVTNGDKNWVQDSSRRFLPGLLPMLSQIGVVSARALYEDTYPGDPFMWKHAAFEHLMTKERYFPADTGLNLIALGDQFPEIDAARYVVGLIGGASAVKTVKFKQAPSVSELLGQLGKMQQTLGKIVQGKANQSYGMEQRDLPPFSGHLQSSATAWKCSAEVAPDCAGCADPLARVKDIWGLLV